MLWSRGAGQPSSTGGFLMEEGVIYTSSHKGEEVWQMSCRICVGN
jgi:hypothetical protein